MNHCLRHEALRIVDNGTNGRGQPHNENLNGDCLPVEQLELVVEFLCMDASRDVVALLHEPMVGNLRKDSSRVGNDTGKNTGIVRARNSASEAIHNPQVILNSRMDVETDTSLGGLVPWTRTPWNPWRVGLSPTRTNASGADEEGPVMAA